MIELVWFKYQITHTSIIQYSDLVKRKSEECMKVFASVKLMVSRLSLVCL